MRYTILIFTILITLIACSQQTDESKNTDIQPNAIEKTGNKNDMMQTNKDIAHHLASLANDVPNVHDAAAIVAGPYAVVAVDIDDMTKRERVGTVKYSVTEALQHDPYGRTAVVIADADIMTRIREMADEMKNGKPIKGVTDELANIVSRYMPTIPPSETKSDNDYKQEPSHDSE